MKVERKVKLTLTDNDIFVIANLEDRQPIINWSLGYFKDKDKANKVAYDMNTRLGGRAIVVRIKEYEE